MLDAQAGEFAGAYEDSEEHGAGEAAGVGVTQRGMVAGEEAQAVGQGVFGSVGEGVVGFFLDDAGVEEVGEVAVEGDLAEADDDSDAGEGLDFSGEMLGAVADLLGEGLVAGRGAADDGGDPGVAETEAVVAGDGAGFGGEAEVVEDGVHEVAGAVSGEGAAGAVGTVGAGGESKDEDAGFGIAEAGDGAGPVGLVLVGAAAGFADAAAVVAQTGAAFAGGDGVVNLLKDLIRNLYAGGCHCISMITAVCTESRGSLAGGATWVE